MSLEQTTENNKNHQETETNKIQWKKADELNNLFKPLKWTNNVFVCDLNKLNKKLEKLIKNRKLFKKYVEENYSKDGEIKIKNYLDCNLMVFTDKYFKDIEKYSTKKNNKPFQ